MAVFDLTRLGNKAVFFFFFGYELLQYVKAIRMVYKENYVVNFDDVLKKKLLLIVL